MKKILLSLLFINISFSQKNIFISEDEFYKISRKIIQDNTSDSDSIRILIKKLEKSDNKAIQAYSYIAKAFSYKTNLDSIKYIKNIESAKKLLQLAEKNNFTKKIKSSLLNFEGVFYKMNNQNDKAIFKLIEARNLALETEDFNTMIGIDFNISTIYKSIGNLNKSILLTKQNLINLEKHQSFIHKNNIDYKKCLNLASLGNLYNEKYLITKNKKYLDSAISSYQKGISNQVPSLKAEININMGSLFSSKNEFQKAKFYFLSVEEITKPDILLYTTLQSNIAYVNFETKDYKACLKNCKIIDSIYTQKTKGVISEYVLSNYLQSKIYEQYKDEEKMLHYAKIHLEHKKEMKNNLNEEIEIINSMTQLIDKDEEFNKRIEALNKKNNLKIYLIIFIIVLINIFLIYFLNKKFKFTTKKLNPENTENKQKETLIDDEKEKQILEKVIALENEKYYLDIEFNQKELAKRIKTNTTYLSYVFNKHNNQSFNQYYNDLRINYAIEQITNDSKFREYSTQAIAESAGFKNADSFTNSFKKKTGKTPFQFINDIKSKTA